MVVKLGVAAVLGTLAGLALPVPAQTQEDCPDEICVQAPCELYWDYINKRWIEVCDHSRPCEQSPDVNCSPGSGTQYPCIQVYCPIYS